MIYSDAKTIQKIVLDSCVFITHPIELSKFMEEVERVFGDIPENSWLEIEHTNSLTINLVRYETPEEFKIRLDRANIAKAEYQGKKNASWERQKRKYARARK